MPWSHKQEYPQDNIPERIRLSNGLTRTDSTTFTDEELIAAGWVEVNSPNHNDETHKCEWVDGAWTYIELSDFEKYAIRPDLAPDSNDITVDDITRVDD